MKICFVVYGLDIHNGYGRVAHNLIKGLSKKGIGGPIVTFQNRQIPKKLADRTHAVLKHPPTSPLSHPLSLLRDWYYIKKISKDCDLIHFISESFLATTIFGINIPYVVTAHGTWAIKPLLSNPISRTIFSRAYKRASKVVTVSAYTKKRIQNLAKLDNINVIYNGVDNNAKISINKTPSNELHILSVGSLDPSKGYDFSIRGVCKFANKYHKKVVYHIVSGRKNGLYEQKLEHIAAKYGYYNLKLYYQINDPELNKLYSLANIFLLTPVEIDNDFEGFGLIFIEAFCAGLPVIASKSGAIPEIVQDLKTGILVPEGNSKAISDAISLLVSNNRLRKEIIKNAYNISGKYTIDVMVDAYTKIYEKVRSKNLNN